MNKRALLCGAAALVLAGGGLVGYDVFVRESGCHGLLEDRAVQRLLGDRYAPDMECGELGAAVRDATTGSAPGRHTLVQARNMQAVVVALSKETERRKDPVIAAGLRGPLADALVDYAADTHATLAGEDGHRPRRHRAPWEEEGTVRMPVGEADLVRALRAVSEDPQAYARLRNAQTEVCAETMASVPAASSITVEKLRSEGTEAGVVRCRGQQGGQDRADSGLHA
ncbi:hypothetical protein [Streptomyces sp. Da 82-17]|uniref:hypothetical protein n=1 Tax=Streptomyces sp. Da 82-17 TaxID=3377116 RepID=UPI0038D41F65